MNVSSSPKLLLLLLAGVLTSLLQLSVKAQVALDAGQPTLVSVGPHEIIWNTGTSRSGGRIVTMETGMNYWDGHQWVPSVPTFELADDAFVANRLQHKIRLAPDLNRTGAVTIVTPDGITLHSTPVGIGLYDAASGQSAIIAGITNCSGVLVRENRVVYVDAFAGAGVCADVVYTIERGSFAQDVVITGRLNPADYGFPTNTTRIQIFTEFYQSPEPERIHRPLRVEKYSKVRARMVSPDLIDEALGFGELVLATGRATTVANISDPAAPAAPVAKQFITVAGRTFLIESVEYGLVKNDLMALPECGTRSAWMLKPKKGKLADLPIPSANSAAEQAKVTPKPEPPRVAQANFHQRNGFAIDYLASIGGALSGTRVFAGDTTYFLTNAVTCNGAVIIESGAVFKFPTNSTSYLKLTGTVTCKTTSFRPSVFTAADDDTIGDTLSTNIWAGYTGTIRTSGYGNPALWVYYLSSSTLSHLRFRYSQEAIRIEGTGGYVGTVAHAQLVNCIRGIVLTGAGGGGSAGGITVTVNNSLLVGVQQPLSINCTYSTNNFYHTTIGSATALITSSVDGAYGYFCNSVFANVTNLYSGSGSASAVGDHNGFYSSPTFGSSQYSSSGFPFQSVGAGNFYLTADSPFRNVGITNGLGSLLLKELRKRTTYPPTVLSNLRISISTNLVPQASRDTNSPDLGFHYDVLDYLVDTCVITNATLTITNGVSVGYDNAPTGFWLQNGSSMVSVGTPVSPNWFVHYAFVQEQPVLLGGSINSGGIGINSYHDGSPAPDAVYRFTRFVAPTGRSTLYHYSSWAYTNLLVQDCEFWNGENNFGGDAGSIATVRNNLFHRSSIYASSFATTRLTFSNNLVFGTSATFLNVPSTNLWRFHDNAFDTCTVSSSFKPLTNSHNAYVNCSTNRLNPTNINDVVLANFTYASGPLGDFYQPTSSPLINAGSVTNAALVGLYQYTTTTNQAPETTSRVDIGYHYFAVDANGNPIDLDGDGVPDTEDADSNDANVGRLTITIDEPADGTTLH